ncbi:MAG: helix-turn-helix domain-containing protein [Nannocystaceae bacterium]
MRVETSRLRVVDLVPPDTSIDGASNAHPTPGAYVRDHRKRRGFSLEQLAAATKIPKRQLQAIEDERFDELPGLVFVKGFLRCCARALKLDEEVLLGLLYEQERAALRGRRRDASPAPRQGTDGAHSRSAVARVRALPLLPTARLLMWSALLVIIVLFVLVAFTLAANMGGTELLS